MAKRHWNRTGDLESLFLRLEELVLANSGEDEFEEVFKLLIAKLWDERSGKAARFNAYSREEETYSTIVSLLREAEKAWPGVLGTDLEPRLTPTHLQVCVEAMAPHTLSDSNLQVLDGFFEFLVGRSAKGAKGQFFTPRHVVDFCVRMLKPTSQETVLDPACGSGGFLIHAVNYVQQHENLDTRALQAYCESKVWGFDISTRAVRVARALMILAGGSSGNIIRLNTLLRPEMRGLFIGDDPENSGLSVEDVCRTRMRKHRGFDLILTNPPFAGEVRERAILDGYAASRGRERVERDALFVERCVELLSRGGRMAVVLPHNKLAGTAFEHVRKWIFRHAKVLAVVGLGRHTFLPHTHQKASVMFLERRKEGETGKLDEPIFFAISEHDGKNSKGQLLYRPGTDEDAPVWDRVQHDFAPIVSEFHKFRESARI